MLVGGGGKSTMQLGFSIYLKDQFSGPAAKIKSTLDGMQGEYAAYRANLTAARNVTAAIATATLAMSWGLYNAAMEGAQFLHTMQGVLAISEATTAEFENLKTLAVVLGRQTIFTPDQVASGMRFMAMAGQTASQIQATAQDATFLAAATMTQLGGKLGAADILTNALKAFGLTVESSTQMSDILTYATTSANVSLIDLGNSIRYVASTSKNLNIPIQDTIGFIMALGNAGIQSSMAGTALENMFRYLAMSISDFSTKLQKSAWQTLGLTRSDVTTAEGSFKPMIDVLGMLKVRLDEMGAVDRQNILKEIFGVRGQRAAGTILRNLDQAAGFVETLNKPGIRGTAEEKSHLMMETLHGSSLKLTSALDGLRAAWAEALGSTFMKAFLVGLSKIVGGITWFLKLPVVGTIAAITAGVLTLAGAWIGLRAILMTIALTIDGIRNKWSTMALAGQVAMAKLTKSSAALAATTAATSTAVGATAGKAAASGVAGAVVGGGAVAAAKKGFSAAIPFLRWLPKIGRFLLRAIGGPWGMALVAIATFLPMIIGGLSKLAGATSENTAAIKKGSEFDPRRDEVMALISSQTHAQTMALLDKHLQRLLGQGALSVEQRNKLLSTDDGIFRLLSGAIFGAEAEVPKMIPVEETAQTNGKMQ